MSVSQAWPRRFPFEIFPEYYILKVNGFNDLAEDSLDEWIFFLKNSEIKKEFSAKGLQKAAVELDILKLSKEDREDYENYIEDQRVVESSIRTSWAEGEMKGKIEGKIEGKNERNAEIAIEMIKDGESTEKIMRYTGLTSEQIGALRDNKWETWNLVSPIQVPEVKCRRFYNSKYKIQNSKLISTRFDGWWDWGVEGGTIILFFL